MSSISVRRLEKFDKEMEIFIKEFLLQRYPSLSNKNMRIIWCENQNDVKNIIAGNLAIIDKIYAILNTMCKIVNKDDIPEHKEAFTVDEAVSTLLIAQKGSMVLLIKLLIIIFQLV